MLTKILRYEKYCRNKVLNKEAEKSRKERWKMIVQKDKKVKEKQTKIGLDERCFNKVHLEIIQTETEKTKDDIRGEIRRRSKKTGKDYSGGISTCFIKLCFLVNFKVSSAQIIFL